MATNISSSRVGACIRRGRQPNAAEKALYILDTLGGQNKPLRLCDITSLTGLSKSTTHRLLAILCEHRMAKSVDGSYVLGARVMEWVTSSTCTANRTLHTSTLPYLIDLLNETHHTVYLGVLAGPVVQYVTSLYGHNAVRTPSRLRGWAPAYCTAIGKVLLATEQGRRPHTDAVIDNGSDVHKDMNLIRYRGFAECRGEYVRGVACVAVPLVNRFIDVPAAIAVSERAERFDYQRAVQALKRTTLACTVAIGHMAAMSASSSSCSTTEAHGGNKSP